MTDDPNLQRARAQLVRLLHLRHLGLDPAISRYRANEARTANAVEAVTGERLERATGVGDWRGTRTGRIYDDCSPAPGRFFDAQFDNWTASLIGHTMQTQGIDVVTVDPRGRGLTRAQMARLVAALNALPDAAKRKVLLLVDVED